MHRYDDIPNSITAAAIIVYGAVGMVICVVMVLLSPYIIKEVSRMSDIQLPESIIRAAAVAAAQVLMAFERGYRMV